MKYEIYAPLGTSPKPLKKHLARYEIDAKLSGVTLMSDGGGTSAPGWAIFTPLTTSVSLGLMSAGVIGPAGVAVGAGIGVVLDIFYGQKGKDKPPQPYPVATLIRIEFRNVSPQRANWAEYILCGFCQQQDWQILTDLRNPQNQIYAARGRPAPTPWAESKNKRPPAKTSRRKKKEDTATYVDKIFSRIFGT